MAIDMVSIREEQLGPSNRHRSRLRQIYLRWQQARRHPLAMDYWSEPLPVVAGRLGALLAFASSFLLIPFSQAIIPLSAEAKLPPVGITLLPFHPQAQVMLVLLFLINAWLLDRHLAQRTAQERRVCPWLRWLRFAACGIPLLGPFAILGWRWVLRQQPQWAFRDAKPVAPFLWTLWAPAVVSRWYFAVASRSRRYADMANRLLTTEVGIGFLQIANAIALGIAVWSRTTAHPEPAQRLLVAILGLLFHLVAFGGILLFLDSQAQRAQANGFSRWSYLSFSLLWLIPFPYFALGGLLGLVSVWMILDTAPQERALIYQAYASHRTGFLPFGLTFEETLRRQWRGASLRERLLQPGATLPPAVELTHAHERISWLYRVKSILLGFDAMALGWIALWFADWHPGWTVSIESTLNVVVSVSGLLCLLGMLIMATYLGAMALRSSGRFDFLEHHPYAQYLVITQLSLMMGLEVGQSLFHRDTDTLARTFQTVGFLGCSAAFVVFLLRIFLPGGERIKKPNSGILGVLGFLAIGGLGQGAVVDGMYAQGLMSWVQIFTIASPLLHVLFGRLFLSWLLRPFAARHLFVETLPVNIRRALRFLIVSLVLPLGGLAIPLWIYLRHRKWPSWESRFLGEANGAWKERQQLAKET